LSVLAGENFNRKAAAQYLNEGFSALLNKPNHDWDEVLQFIDNLEGPIRRFYQEILYTAGQLWNYLYCD
jgi:hypothetical protein